MHFCTRGDRRRRAAWCAALLLLPAAITACGAGKVAAKPTAAPSPTATISVNFTVDVTAVATPKRSHTAPTATPTPFVAPRGSYLVLLPATGPPVSQTISVRGGHLPKSAQIDLDWSLGRHSTPLTTTAQSDKRGSLTTHFAVPASPPGLYTITARVQGVPYASATYRVASRAVLSVSVVPGASGDTVQVTGRSFISGMRLLLAVYPMFRGPKPSTLGTVHASGSGRITFTTTTSKLPPGEYVLRAFSLRQLTVEMAETYLEVVS